MALNVQVGVFTDHTTTGNKDITLPANFDPKAIILWGTKNTADGTIAHNHYGVGFGTYRGSAVQRNWSCIKGVDAATAADCAQGSGIDALFKMFVDTANSAAIDFELELVSMTTGSGSKVTINVVNAAPAAWRIHYMILGGSAITDAYTLKLDVPAASPADFTIVSGFGKPELLFFHHALEGATALNDASFGFGFAKQGDSGHCIAFTQEDGNTASLTGHGTWSNKIHQNAWNPAAAAVTELASGALDATVANWPTDGFRSVWTNMLAAGDDFFCLALRTTAQIATGADTAPTTGTPPVSQDDDVGFTPKAAMVIGSNAPAVNGWRTSDTNNMSMGIGAYDGTNEGWAGFSEDDALGTMNSNTRENTAKTYVVTDQVAAIDGECDGVFTGTTFRRSWNDLCSSAFPHEWLVLGDPAATDHPLDAQPGSYSLTGAAATLARSLLMDAQPGTYTLTGAAALLAKGFTLDAQAGAYALTGLSAALEAARVVDAQPGAYAITGADAALLADRVLSALAGSYALTGFDAGLVVGAVTDFVLAADPGSFTLVGSPASTLADRVLSGDPAAYTLAGVLASIAAARVVDAQPGAYLIDRINERRTVSIFGGYTSGNFRLTFKGQQTGNLLWNATAAQVQSALEALTNVDPGEVYCTEAEHTSDETCKVMVEFRGQWGSQDIPTADFTVQNVDLAPEGSISMGNTMQGSAGTSAALLADRVISADSGAYTLTGAQAQLLADRVIVAAAAAYIISGLDATLESSGAPPVAQALLRMMMGMGR